MRDFPAFITCLPPTCPPPGELTCSDYEMKPHEALKLSIQAVQKWAERTEGGGAQTLATFIDSGADISLIDEELAVQLGIDQVPLPSLVSASTLDSHLLGAVSHQTMPIHMLLFGNHHETIQFHILKSPHLPLILGYPWLRCYNLHIDWATGPSWGGVPPAIRSASNKLLHLCCLLAPVRPPTCMKCPPNSTTFGRCSARQKLPPCPLIGPTTVP